MNGSRTVHLRGISVRVRDSAEVQSDECLFCELTPSAAVAELRKRLNAGQSIVACSGCTDALGAEVTRQLRQRRAS